MIGVFTFLLSCFSVRMSWGECVFRGWCVALASGGVVGIERERLVVSWLREGGTHIAWFLDG